MMRTLRDVKTDAKAPGLYDNYAEKAKDVPPVCQNKVIKPRS